MMTNSAIKQLQEQHSDAKKEFDKWKKELDTKIETEIKALVKERFDYEIPIVQVEKAGISSIGTKIENDLMWQKGEERNPDTVKVLDEFKEYFKLNPLWQTKFENF
jgi:type I restriction enzyme M protein